MTKHAKCEMAPDAVAAFDAHAAAFASDPDIYLVVKDKRGMDNDGDWAQALTYRRYWPDGGYTLETRHYYWPR